MRCRSLGILACTVVAPLLAVFCSSSMEVGKQAACNASAGTSPLAKVPPAKTSALHAHLEPAPPGDLLRGNEINLMASTPVPATAYQTEASPGFRGEGTPPEERSPPKSSSVAAALDRLSGPRSPSNNASAEPSSVIPGRLVAVSGIEEITQTQPIRSTSRTLHNGGSREEIAASFDGHPMVDPAPPSAADRFAWIQDRLRQLGATYYRLETWGDRGGAFRFQCRIAFGQDARSVRHFEAVDPDAVRAMATVLRQVESLQAGAGQN